MFSIKRIFTILLYIFFLNNGMTQNIELKTPLENASFTSDLTPITFLWEDNQANNWELDLSNNINFIGATTYLSNTESYEININTLNNQVYYWRIRSSLDTSLINTFTVFNLNNLGNLAYHINAQTGITSNAGKVAQWNNLVGSQYDANQSNAYFQPELASSLINNHDVVKFGEDNGNIATNLTLNDFLIADTNFTFISISQQISLNSVLSYIVGAQNPPNGVYSGGTNSGGRNFGILSNNGNGNNSIRVSGTTKLDFQVRSCNYNKLFINSDIQSVVYNGNVSQLNFNTIGLRPDDPTLNFHGYLGDIIIYNEVLSDSSRLLVENYLRTKYTPYPDLGKDTIVCGPEIKIGFRTDHGYSSRTWSTGATDVDSITITQNGTYWVTVESFGTTITDTINITGIVPIPQISLSNDQVICFGDSIQIDYTPITGFTPIWSNGQSANSIIVKDSSQYVQITHTDINNCTASSDSYYISVDSLQLQSTLGNDRNICNGENIYASTTSNQGPFKYNWSTGDTTSFTNTPTFGLQDIYVEMTDFNSCIFKDTVQINAINLPAPIVDFSFDTVCPNSPTHFIDLSSPGSTDNIIDWKWAFINNDSAFTSNAEYVFPQGNFNVSLSVETDSGCVNTVVKQIYTHKQPTAKINTPIMCAQGEDKIFSSSYVSVPDFITNYNWTIDNNNYTSASPEVIFNNEGMNEVELVVITDKGCVDTLNQFIEVFPALLPDFEASNICIGDSTQFTDITPSFSVVEKEWNFGVFNASTSSENNPKFLYSSPGAYQVSLQITNAIGCKNTITKPITIHEAPTTGIYVENTCAKDLSIFIDSSLVNNGFISSMTWEINGETFNKDSLNYQFDSAGVQNIHHSIIDNFGCYNDSSFQIQIKESPEVDFEFSPNYGTAPIEITFNNLTNDAVDYLWDFGDNNGTSNEKNPIYNYTENGFYNIILSATNQFGCSNSIYKQLIITPTELDLELSNLSFTKTIAADGSIAYKASVLLKNVGSRLITNIDLYAAVDNETKISETWTGTLERGQAFLYEFTSSFVIQNKELLDYLCVKGTNVNDNTEENLENNTICEIQQGAIQYSPIYPNPTNDIAYIDVVSENKGNLILEVYDLLGAKAMALKNITLEKGYNKISIDCVTLQAGTYFVNLIYLDETSTQKLVISNQ